MLCRFFAGALASGGHGVVVTWFALCESNYTEYLHVLCKVHKLTYNGKFNENLFLLLSRKLLLYTGWLIAQGKQQQIIKVQPVAVHTISRNALITF